ncbi:hypothetical protein DAH55_20830 [Sphingomonas koreensis]|nr:hypothetical protein [Sphingomonas koreensis]RSU54932.1 hypothetical protein DAH56_20800 [Sphingomonas koreensis]RSU63174.1 hypothetical protein DAH55_20830 [Sphingomonas koreensis]
MDWAIRRRSLGHHPVELLALELATRNVQFLEYRDKLDTLAFGVGADRGALSGNAGILAALFIDADADIAISAESGFHLIFSFLQGRRSSIAAHLASG